MLHTISKSPFSHDALRECLRLCSNDAAIILIEDGVYAATANTAWAKELTTRCKNVYVLTADLAARGLNDHVDENIKSVDYAGFVQLCCQHATIQSWY
jgi:tRNA 2-thiouridine synthesizing protein B